MKKLTAILCIAFAAIACNRQKSVVVHASFTTDKDVYDISEPVFISNTSTVENGLLGICKWEWGEDNVSFEDEIDCIVFNDVGDYLIKLTVYADGGGGQDVFTKSVTIEDHSEPETDIIYVSIEGAGLKDGSSWNDALDAQGLRALLSGNLKDLEGQSIRLQSGLYELGDSVIPLEGQGEETVKLSISGGFSSTGSVTSDPSILSAKGEHGLFSFKGNLYAYFNRCTLANTSGSVIILDDPSVTLSMNRCTVSGGNAETGGAVYVTDGKLTATSTTFSGNKAMEDGGAFFIGGGHIELSACTISDNTAKRGGGMIISDKAELIFDPENATVFRSNGATENGGALCYDCPFEYDLTGCEFRENRTDGNGGGLYNCSSGHLTVENCVFAENFATLYGGGIYDENESTDGMDVVGCTFTGNDGGVRDGNATAKTAGGGGIALGGGYVKVQNCTFEDNFGQFGGAVEAVRNCTSDFIQCTFLSNRTNLLNAWNCYGGVCYIHQNNASGATVRFNKCYMSGNTSTSAGVFYLASGTIYMNACVMYDNSMKYQCGSVLQNSGGKFFLNNCTISKAYTKYKMSTYTNASWAFLKNAGTSFFSNCSIIGLVYHNTSTYSGSAGLIYASTANCKMHYINNMIVAPTAPSSTAMQAITAAEAVTGSQTYLYNKMSTCSYAKDRITLSEDPETLNGTDYLATTDYFGGLDENTGTSFNTYYWSWNGQILAGTNPGKASTEDVSNAIKSVDTGFWNWLKEIDALGKDQRGMPRGIQSWPGAYDGGDN